MTFCWAGGECVEFKWKMTFVSLPLFGPVNLFFLKMLTAEIVAFLLLTGFCLFFVLTQSPFIDFYADKRLWVLSLSELCKVWQFWNLATFASSKQINSKLKKSSASVATLNPLKSQLVKLLHYAIMASPTVFNFWHSGTVALRAECQSARMSEIENGRLGLYGTGYSKCNRLVTLGFKGPNCICSMTNSFKSLRNERTNEIACSSVCGKNYYFKTGIVPDTNRFTVFHLSNSIGCAWLVLQVEMTYYVYYYSDAYLRTIYKYPRGRRRGMVGCQNSERPLSCGLV